MHNNKVAIFGINHDMHSECIHMDVWLNIDPDTGTLYIFIDSNMCCDMENDFAVGGIEDLLNSLFQNPSAVIDVLKHYPSVYAAVKEHFMHNNETE